MILSSPNTAQNPFTSALSTMDTAVLRFINNGQLPGIVVLVSRAGQIAYQKAFGDLNIATGQKMTPDALFRLESMTKPVTSAGVMVLCDQGKLCLDDPVAKYIPAFARTRVYAGQTEAGLQDKAPSQPVTVRQLLTHTSGLSYGNYDTVVDALYRQALMGLGFSDEGIPTTPISLSTFADCIAQLPLAFHPGHGWQYSFGLDIAGYLIELVSGQSLPDFLQEYIFDPLDMGDTDFKVPSEKLGRFGPLYHPGANGYAVVDSPETSKWRNPLFIESGGGLVSTVRDYHNFCLMLLHKGQFKSNRVLTESSVNDMMMNQLPDAVLPIAFQHSDALKGCGFGIGFDVMLDVTLSGRLGSNGMVSWSGAASTGFWIDPAESIICIVLAQVVPNALPHLDLLDVVYTALRS